MSEGRLCWYDNNCCLVYICSFCYSNYHFVDDKENGDGLLS